MAVNLPTLAALADLSAIVIVCDALHRGIVLELTHIPHSHCKRTPRYLSCDMDETVTGAAVILSPCRGNVYTVSLSNCVLQPYRT